MNLVVYYKTHGGEPTVTVIHMEYTTEAYMQGSSWHEGYMIPADKWDAWMFSGGEYILSAMYEGYASSGSSELDQEDGGGLGYSWAVLPENIEESEHLRQHCYKTDFWEHWAPIP